MKNKISCFIIACIFCIGWHPALKAELYKGDPSEKKELSTNQGTSSLTRPTDESLGGDTGSGSLYPTDETLPEGDPIGLPVDESAAVAVLMLALSASYIIVKRNYRRFSVSHDEKK